MKNECILSSYLGNKSPTFVPLIIIHGGQKYSDSEDGDFGHYMNGFQLILPISTVSSDLSPSQVSNFLLYH